MLSETGIVGFLFLLLAFFIFLKLFGHGVNVYLYNKKTLNDFQICILICFYNIMAFTTYDEFFNN